MTASIMRHIRHASILRHACCMPVTGDPQQSLLDVWVGAGGGGHRFPRRSCEYALITYANRVCLVEDVFNHDLFMNVE